MFGKTREKGELRYLSRCRPCFKAQQRSSNWQKTYNITSQDYEAIKQSQGGKCAICQRATGQRRALAVDHDHACCKHAGSCGGCVRGLLCSRCNKMLGFARDDPEMFRRAINYLAFPPAKSILAARLPERTAGSKGYR